MEVSLKVKIQPSNGQRSCSRYICTVVSIPSKTQIPGNGKATNKKRKMWLQERNPGSILDYGCIFICRSVCTAELHVPIYPSAVEPLPHPLSLQRRRLPLLFLINLPHIPSLGTSTSKLGFGYLGSGKSEAKGWVWMDWFMAKSWPYCI